MNNTKYAVILALALFTRVSAQHLDAGTVAFPFLNLGYDARTVAMAGAAVAVPNDIYGALSNPAALAYANRKQIMGGYRQIIMDVWGSPLGIALPTRHGVFAPHLLSLTTGNFDVIDESGVHTGERAWSSYNAFGVSWARLFGEGNIAAGATLRGMYHYLGAGVERYSADAFTIDIGAQYRTNNNRLIYGAALRNWGVMRSGYWGEWNEYELPYGVEVGVSWVPRHIRNLRVALDVNKFNGDYTNFEPAFEYTVIAKTLFLRGGYNFSSMDLEKMFDVFSGLRDEDYQKSSINTFSFGFGIAGTMDNVDINLDAAIQLYSSVAAPSLVVSLIVAF
jgi:hypothetical protein